MLNLTHDEIDLMLNSLRYYVGQINSGVWSNIPLMRTEQRIRILEQKLRDYEKEIS